MVVPHRYQLSVQHRVCTFAIETHCEHEVVTRSHPVLLEVVLIGDLVLCMGPNKGQIAVRSQTKTRTGTSILKQEVRDVVIQGV